jgi:hypothetical protein
MDLLFAERQDDLTRDMMRAFHEIYHEDHVANSLSSIGSEVTSHGKADAAVT